MESQTNININYRRVVSTQDYDFIKKKYVEEEITQVNIWSRLGQGRSKFSDLTLR